MPAKSADEIAGGIRLICLSRLRLCAVTRESKADGQDKPVDEPKITSIRVETYGVDYGEPETIEPFNYYNWLMKQYSTTKSSNN